MLPQRTTVAVAFALLGACNGQINGGPTGPGGAAGTGGKGGSTDATGPGDGSAGSSIDGSVGPPPRPEILPVVILTVNDRSPGTLGDDKVSGHVRVVVDHDGTLLDLPARAAAFESWIGISLRGSSSQGFAQKPFGIELRDAIGDNRKLPVLDMPADADWGLIPCWTDKPCLRNALVYVMGQQFGRWTPHFRFVEVVFNGVYQGLYQLTELPRPGKNRIPFSKPATDQAAGDITGSYLWSREATGKDLSTAVPPKDWLSPGKSPDPYPNRLIYSYRNPDYREITTAQNKYLQDYVASFEAMMAAPTWADATKGYRAWIDMPSWVDYALVQEVTGNIDSYWKSMYFLKEPDPPGGRGKVFMEPIWDFNLGFGNANYREGWKADVLNIKAANAFENGGWCVDTSWLPQGPPVCDQTCCTGACKPPLRCWNIPIIPFYWNRLWADPTFLKEVKCRWQELRKPGAPFTMPFVDRAIAEWQAQIGPLAIERHFRQWPALLAYVWPNPYLVDPTTAPRPGASVKEFFEGEVAWMRSWVSRRLTYLDANLPGTCDR